VAKQQENKPSKKEEDWMTKKWRPMMAIMYMMVCVFDFILFPIMFTAVQFWETQAANDAFRQWNPLTLLGGGLFHVAMGAVLGVSAWSRGQEKIAGVASGPISPSLPAPSAGGSTFGVSAPTTNSWGSQPLGGSMQSAAYNPAPNWGSTQVAAAPVTMGFGGKLAPPQPDFYPER
jgi:hypothetical protein